MTTALFRYPDKPTASGPGILPTLADGEWLAQMKHDGFRCLVEWNGHTPTLTSREQKPIPASIDLRCDLIAALDGLAPMLLDAEWMGRRDGQREGLVLFDVLAVRGRWLGEEPAWDRFLRLVALRGVGGAPLRVLPPTVRLVDWTHEGYPAFFERSKQPGVEGIVLKHRASRFIGSTRRCVDNPQWLKVRWRGGEDGQTPLC